MKTSTIALGAALLGTIVGVGLGIVLERKEIAPRHLGKDASAETPPLVPPAEAASSRGPLVRTARVESGHLQVPVEMLGAAARPPGSVQVLSLRSEVLIVRQLVVPGDRIDAGLPVLEVRPTAASVAAIKSAETAVSASRAELAAIQERVDAHLGTRTEVMQAERALGVLKFNLELLLANAPPADGLVRLDVAGFVSAMRVSVGAVAPADGPLFDYAPAESLAVRFGIPLAVSGDLSPGLELAVAELLSGGRLTGESVLARIEAALDPVAHTRVGWTERMDPAQWKEGTPVRVTANVTSPEGLLVPRGAVVLSDDGPALFQNDGGTARRHAVVLLGMNVETACVQVAGLQVGDQVVVLGGHELEDGAVIQVEGPQ